MIASLFVNGEQGAWFDPTDLNTLFQDAAGTTPVTAIGQPVGLIRDKSGNNNHASQAVAKARPVLQQDDGGRFYLAFDGVDDFLATPTIDLSATDKATVLAGLRKLSDAAVKCPLQFESAASSGGAFAWLYPPIAGSELFEASVRGSSLAYGRMAAGAAPRSDVFAVLYDIGQEALTDEIVLRQNGLQKPFSASTGTAGTGNFAAQELYVGANRLGAANFSGHVYGLILRGAQATDQEMSMVENYLGQNFNPFTMWRRRGRR